MTHAWNSPPVPYTQYPGGIYYFAFQLLSIRVRKSTGTRDKREAARIAKECWQKALGEARRDRDGGPASSPNKPNDMTLDALSALFYEKHICGVSKPYARPEDVHRSLNNIIRTIGKDVMMTSISEDTIAAYLVKRRPLKRGGRRSEVSLNNEISLIGQLFNYARKKCRITNLQEIDWKEFKVAEDKLPTRTRVISADEINSILDNIRPDYRPILEFDLCIGMRRGALCNLRWSNIVWHTKTISYRQKGDLAHDFFMTPDMERILRAEEVHKTSPTSHVFGFFAEKTTTNPRTGKRYEKGKRYRITPAGLRSEWKRTIERLGIPHVMLHDIRRTVTTAFLTAGVDTFTTSKAMGWKSDRMVKKVYAQLPALHLQDAALRTAAFQAVEQQRARTAKDVAVLEKAPDPVEDPAQKQEAAKQAESALPTAVRKKTARGDSAGAITKRRARNPSEPVKSLKRAPQAAKTALKVS